MVEGRQAALFRLDPRPRAYRRPDRPRSMSSGPRAGRSGRSRGSPARCRTWPSAQTVSGSRFAARCGEPARSFAQPDLYVADAAPAAVPRNLTDSFEGDIGSALTGDQHAPAARPARRSGTASRRRSSTWRPRRDEPTWWPSTASGKVAKPHPGDHEVIAFTASGDGSRLALVVADATEPGDLFLLEPGSAPSERLTALNAKLFDEVDIAPLKRSSTTASTVARSTPGFRSRQVSRPARGIR